METKKKGSKHKLNSPDKNDLSEYDILEDGEDLSFLEKAAAEATYQAFEKALKSSAEILIVQDGKLIRKKLGEPDQIISELEQREVEVGKKYHFRPTNGKH